MQAVNRLPAIERERWADQCARLRAWLDVAPRDGAEAIVADHARRDLAQLQSALAGKTPSAVFDRADDPRHRRATARRLLAQDEAAHAADNALVFARRLAEDGSDRDRPRLVRWLGRLQLELADTELPPPVPDFRDIAVELARGDASTVSVPRLAEDLTHVRDRLYQLAAPARDHAAVAAKLLADVPVLADKIAAACALDDPDAAKAGLTEALRFVALAAASDVPLTPSTRVDAAWHELVLCTRAYADLCASFGRFVHHEPGPPSPVHAAQLRETLRRYHLAYGTPDPAWWGETADAHGVVADCGACESP